MILGETKINKIEVYKKTEDSGIIIAVIDDLNFKVDEDYGIIVHNEDGTKGVLDGRCDDKSGD